MFRAGPVDLSSNHSALFVSQFFFFCLFFFIIEAGSGGLRDGGESETPSVALIGKSVDLPRAEAVRMCMCNSYVYVREAWLIQLEWLGSDLRVLGPRILYSGVSYLLLHAPLSKQHVPLTPSYNFVTDWQMFFYSHTFFPGKWLGLHFLFLS